MSTQEDPLPATFVRRLRRRLPGFGLLVWKGHPELTGADLVVSHATNTLSSDARAILRDTSLYYPRFVRLTFSRG